jgi:hypothetical protein
MILVDHIQCIVYNTYPLTQRSTPADIPSPDNVLPTLEPCFWYNKLHPDETQNVHRKERLDVQVRYTQETPCGEPTLNSLAELVVSTVKCIVNFIEFKKGQLMIK